MHAKLKVEQQSHAQASDSLSAKADSIASNSNLRQMGSDGFVLTTTIQDVYYSKFDVIALWQIASSHLKQMKSFGIWAYSVVRTSYGR
eukprot:scaffold1337_cov108-Skeletonema_dohrnii-CCMP3373.AAC.5